MLSITKMNFICNFQFYFMYNFGRKIYLFLFLTMVKVHLHAVVGQAMQKRKAASSQKQFNKEHLDQMRAEMEKYQIEERADYDRARLKKGGAVGKVQRFNDLYGKEEEMEEDKQYLLDSAYLVTGGFEKLTT